jgi:hypothetical protein
MLKALINPGLKRGSSVKRPQQNGPHHGLLELDSDQFFAQPRINLAPLLPLLDESGHQAAALRYAGSNQASYYFAGKERRDQGARKFRAAARFHCKAARQTMQHGPNLLLARSDQRSCLFNAGNLDLGHDAQNMVLALEVIEESPLADIRRLGNVLDCHAGEAALCKEFKSTPEKAQARLGRTALAPPHAAGAGLQTVDY